MCSSRLEFSACKDIIHHIIKGVGKGDGGVLTAYRSHASLVLSFWFSDLCMYGITTTTYSSSSFCGSTPAFGQFISSERVSRPKMSRTKYRWTGIWRSRARAPCFTLPPVVRSACVGYVCVVYAVVSVCVCVYDLVGPWKQHLSTVCIRPAKQGSLAACKVKIPWAPRRPMVSHPKIIIPRRQTELGA